LAFTACKNLNNDLPFLALVDLIWAKLPRLMQSKPQKIGKIVYFLPVLLRIMSRLFQTGQPFKKRGIPAPVCPKHGDGSVASYELKI